MFNKIKFLFKEKSYCFDSFLSHDSYGLTDSARRFMNNDLLRNNIRLRNGRRVPEKSFESASKQSLDLMHKLPYGDQVEYLVSHKKRFYELCNYVAESIGDRKGLKILDIGTSVNTLILKHLFADQLVVTADRLGVNFSEKDILPLLNVDLNDPELDFFDFGDRYDIILFAEILEHLLANPRRVFQFLLKHLTRQGVLILTTPNFFNERNLRALSEGVNPQPIYPDYLKRGEENQYHIREYSRSELMEICDEAGGKIQAAIYSDCFDDVSDIPEFMKGNLVLFSVKKDNYSV